MPKKTICFKYLCFLFVLLLSFAISYLFAYKMTFYNWTDIAIHMNMADAFLDGIESNAYPGFYLVYGFLTRICDMPQAHGAACAMGIFSVLTGVSIYVISGCFIGRKDTQVTRILIVLFMSFFGPLYFGGSSYYVGQGSFNTWHNPTNSGVKFFALACFYLFLYVYQMGKDDKVSVLGKTLGRTHLYLILVFGVCCSLIFKPSFFQVFAPTLVAIYGLDFLRKRKSFGSCVKDAMLFLPAVILILYQMFSVFGSENSGGGMYIYFARGWSFHSDNIFRSIMTNAVFPLFVGVFCVKNFLDNSLFFHSLIFYVVGIAEGLFLCESGSRVSHGNFLWGNNLGIGIIFFSSILVFTKYIRIKENKKTNLVLITGLGLLFAHFCFGLNYILKCCLIGIEYF